MGFFDIFKQKKNDWKVLLVEDDVPLRQFVAERLLTLGVTWFGIEDVVTFRVLI